MNLSETAQVLALAAAYDQRTVGEADVRAWQAALDDIDLEAGMEGVKYHYRHRRDRLMPADIRSWRRENPKPKPVDEECRHGYPSEHYCPFCRRASMRAVEEATP